MTTDARQDELLRKIFLISERVVVLDGLEDVFEHIVRTAAALTGAEIAVIRLFNLKTGMLELVHAYKASARLRSLPALRLGECISGRTVLENRPTFCHDLDLYEHCREKCLRREIKSQEGIRSIISVPMKSREGAIGCVTVYQREGMGLRESDQITLSIFAAQATEAVEKSRLLEQLRKQATQDSLTEVLNKGAILEKLTASLKLASRHAHPVSVIFIDIDDFKRFNDRHGHLLGDKLLFDFSRLLVQCCRKSDTVGRFGGEEFLVVVPHVDKGGTVILANKLLAAVAEHHFAGSEGRVRITFSAGVATAPEDGATAEALLEKADQALYHVKGSGKAAIRAAQP